ncbi:MAG TPA: hypothetical protein VKQ73_09235 [Stellaceae bacterium]|nr:hypothetical protein [Stellaceae bacterium]
MRLYRLQLAIGALGLLVAGAAAAQQPDQHSQIQLQYHELVPAGHDSTAVFLKIFDRIRTDCALVGKAFGKTCVINQLNIYTNANYSGEMAGSKMVNATATIALAPDAGGPAAAPAAAAAAPAK